jgi:hypothetical protein
MAGYRLMAFTPKIEVPNSGDEWGIIVSSSCSRIDADVPNSDHAYQLLNSPAIIDP